MHMIEIVTDTASLAHSASGTISGRIFLRDAARSFPDDGWFDCPVVILAWWIEGLAGLVAGRARTFRGMFMEGPFAFVVGGEDGLDDRIVPAGRRGELDIGIAHAPALLQAALAAGTQVAAACRARQWSSPDLHNLDDAIERYAQ
jgi:hypothetical protein